jgi:tripartite-type tricarboxylate transporter receptor subunit TctC
VNPQSFTYRSGKVVQTNRATSLFDEPGKELNQNFVIDNRPGASGFIAAEAVARAPD